MNLDELNNLIEKETSSLRSERFRRDVREIASGNLFPMRKMKRRLIADVVLVGAANFLFGWLQYAAGLWWITIPACVFAVSFLVLEIMVFYRYWHLEPAANVSGIILKFSGQFRSVTQTLKFIDILIAIFIIVLLVVNTVFTNFLSFQDVGLLLSLKLLTWLSVSKWNARAKRARILAKEFNVN
jgi:hypothetical protein